MKAEIERKFLVKSKGFKNQAKTHHYIVQGYLCKDPERTVRVRIKDDEGWLTIKGKSNDKGTIRMEWETAIPLEDAKALLKLVLDRPIKKIRYIIPHRQFTFEVDEFLNLKDPLILAEIELPEENTTFDKPKWLGKEVTGDTSYYNAMM